MRFHLALTLLLPWCELVLGALATCTLCLGPSLLAVDLEGAQTAGLVLLGREDAAGGTALGSMQLALELYCLARPDGVDGSALPRPILKVLDMRCKLGLQRTELEEGGDCSGKVLVQALEKGGHKRTGPVVLVIKLAMDKGCHLLKVLFGVVERLLEGADLLELVGAPLSLVSEH